MIAYCVKCRDKVTQKSPKIVLTEKGMKMSVGPCPNCGTKTCVMVKSTAGASAKPPAKPPAKTQTKPAVRTNSSKEVHEQNAKNSMTAVGLTKVEKAYIAGFRKAEKLAAKGEIVTTSQQLDGLASKYRTDKSYDEQRPKAPSAKETTWRIFSGDPSVSSKSDKYWNVNHGWGSRKDATKFTDSQKRLNSLPKGGVWTSK